MDNEEFNMEAEMKRMRRGYVRGKIMGGLLLVCAGLLFLFRELGAEIPAWIFTWKTLLIAIGLVGAVKRGFRPGGWMVAILVGAGFLIADFVPGLNIRPFLIPAALILLGLMVMIRPFRGRDHYHRRWARWHRRHHHHHHADWRKECYDSMTDSQDRIESVTVFGGVKKNVISKNFKGGEIVNVFGGAEINLSQADFEGKAELEVTQVMGGTRLIVPQHWQVHSSVNAVLGSVEDKRGQLQSTLNVADKVLVLTGTSVFGGIEIRNA